MLTLSPDLHAAEATNAPPRAPGGGRYRADVQGLRGIAVLLVVAFHAEVAFSGGFVGVDVFFVISGFVITAMLLAERAPNGTMDLGRFYLRRIRRLLPALSVLLTTTLLLSLAFVPLTAQRATAGTGFGAALLNANTYLAFAPTVGGYFGTSVDSNPLLHTWSLSLEEQFYLVVPLALALGWRAGVRRGLDRRRTAGLVLGLVAAVSLPLSWLMTDGSQRVAFYTVPTRAWEFAAGGLLAVIGSRVAGPRAVRTVMGVVGAVLVVSAATLFDGGTLFPGVAALVPVTGAVLLIAAGEAPSRNAVTGALSWRPLQRLGDLSYSWYLWHWPLIAFARGVFPGSATMRTAAAALSIVPAFWSYRFLEARFRTGGTPPLEATRRLAITCTIAPLLAAGVLFVGHDRLQTTAMAESLAFHADFLQGCDSTEPVRPGPQPRCTWPVEGATGEAVMVGDSNAGHFTEGFVAGAHDAGLAARVVTRAACPFVDLQLVVGDVRGDGCARQVAESTAALIELRPDVVVIAMRASKYLDGPYGFLLPDGTMVERTPEARARAWDAALRRVVAPLEGAGIDVVIVHQVPTLPLGWTARGLAPVTWLAPSLFDASVDRATAEGVTEEADTIERTVAEDTDAATLDVTDAVCTVDRCEAHTESGWVYMDATHLSVGASRDLAPLFRDALVEYG